MVPRYLFMGALAMFGSAFVLIQLLNMESSEMPRVFGGRIQAVGYPLEVAYLIFATGKYIKFAEVFIQSMRKYFDCPLCNVTYVIFSDSPLNKPAEDIMLVCSS